LEEEGVEAQVLVVLDDSVVLLLVSGAGWVEVPPAGAPPLS